MVSNHNESPSTILKVIVVDDNEHFRRLLARRLGALEDMQVVGEAADGEEATALARRVVPDAILMDLHMPKMDGLSAAQAIAGELPKTKIFLLTAYPHEISREMAAFIGICAVLGKEQPFEEIVAVLRGSASQ